MARFFKLLAVGSLFAFHFSLFSSCQEGGDAGDLLGQWRATDCATKTVSFSGSIILFRSTHEGNVFGNCHHVGDSLFIECVSPTSSRSDTTLVEQSFGMKPFTRIRLHIDVLDSDRLILSKDGQLWSFEKW
jgi:hypothetical protein